MVFKSAGSVMALSVAVFVVERGIVATEAVNWPLLVLELALEFLISHVTVCIVRHFHYRSSYEIALIYVSVRLLGKADRFLPLFALSPLLLWPAKDWVLLSSPQATEIGAWQK